MMFLIVETNPLQIRSSHVGTKNKVTFTSSDSDGVIVSAVLLGTVTVGDVSPLVGVPIFTYDAGTWEPSCPGQAHSSYSFSFSVTDDEGGSATATCSVP